MTLTPQFANLANAIIAVLPTVVVLYKIYEFWRDWVKAERKTNLYDIICGLCVIMALYIGISQAVIEELQATLLFLQLAMLIMCVICTLASLKEVRSTEPEEENGS